MYMFISYESSTIGYHGAWRRARRTAAVLATLLGATLAPGHALAAEATVAGLGAGLYDTVQGSVGGAPVETFAFVGTLGVRIDGGAPTEAYCVDIQHGIGIGDSEPQVPPDYPCEVVRILNNAFPQAPAIPVPLADPNREAAAVQAAIWHFTDAFLATAPADVAARAAEIVAAAATECEVVPIVPQQLLVSPPSATNYLPAETSHTVTATLLATDGQPLPHYPLDLVVTGAAGPLTFHGATGSDGVLTFAYENEFAVTGTDTITATAAFTVPVGLKFKREAVQGIVLAGAPQAGTVIGTARKAWVPARCGDGVINQAGEACDDGNATDGDGCDANCTPTACGNGIVTPGEACDDGNATDGDGCDANCTPTACGNGIVTPGEACDDGNATDGDGCEHDCTAPACGNGITDAGEACDDGNATDGDGCDHDCTRTACGNGIVTSGEECDDGNAASGDACEADCTLPRCGNGILDAGEACDDGNGTDGDGCSASCHHQEICSNLADDDGDGAIDCDDPDCPSCERIRDDPAVITWTKRGPDRFRMHGELRPRTPCSPFSEGVGVLITNANGVVFRATLRPGDLAPRGRRHTFVDRGARAGRGTRGGLSKVVLAEPRAGRYYIAVEAFGDLGAATLPTMTLQIAIGDDVFFSKGTWMRLPSGWRLEF